jgi:hypothetical protein
MRDLTRLSILATLAFSLLASSNIYAEDWLNKKEVHELLSGNTAKGHYMRPSQSTAMMKQVGVKYRFFHDGSGEKATDRFDSSKGLYIEKGKWSVNKKGKLCTIWGLEEKKKCRRVRRASDGSYELVGKKRNIIIEKVTPGT